MAASFTSNRLMSLPCERMRGLVFCDTYLNQTLSEENNASFGGTPTIDNGLTLNGTSQHASYSISDYDINYSSLSIVVIFYPDFDTDEDVNRYLFATSGSKEYSVFKAGSGASYVLSLRLGNTGIHNVPEATYSPYWNVGARNVLTVSGTTGNTNMWLNGEQIATAKTAAWSATDPATLYVGRSYTATGYFDGIIDSVRIFNTTLDVVDHTHYINEDITGFMTSPYASWRCDAFGDDTDANKIWDRGINKRDLTKGDGSTAGTFPTFNSTVDDEYYTFDGVDDYVSGLPTLPSAYTFTAAKSSAGVNPSVDQHNDDTLHSDLTTSGGHTGRIHGMVLHNTQLTTMQLHHDKYCHLSWLWRGSAFGLYHRLITEDVCQLVMFGDSATPYKDEAGGTTGTDTTVTAHDEDGLEFGSASSNVEFADAAAFRSEEITLFWYGTIPAQDGTLIDKGTNYDFYLDFQSGTTVRFYLNTSYYEWTSFSDVTSVAVTAKDERSRVFSLIVSTSAKVTPT